MLFCIVLFVMVLFEVGMGLGVTSGLSGEVLESFSTTGTLLILITFFVFTSFTLIF